MAKGPHYRFRVRFCEVDRHGIMHNAVYQGHVEAAIYDALRDAGLAAALDPRGKRVFLARRVAIDYLGQLPFDSTAACTVSVEKIGTSSVIFQVDVRRAADDAPAARAEVVWVMFDTTTGKSCPIDPDMIESIKSAVQ